MSDFAATWTLVRGRFLDSMAGLTQEQLNWRLHPGTMTIAEMAAHVAGSEVNFAAQLTDREPEGVAARLKLAATDGVVNDNPVPFHAEELTPDFVAELMAEGERWIGPLITNPSEELRAKQIVSVLGPMIDGTGALARMAYHPSYHHGQVHFIKTAPGFPAA